MELLAAALNVTLQSSGFVCFRIFFTIRTDIDVCDI